MKFDRKKCGKNLTSIAVGDHHLKMLQSSLILNADFPIE